MTFGQSISYCLSHYATFQGRGSRSEYWWFYLFLVLAEIAASIVDWASQSPILASLVNLGLLLPQFAAGTRRLHDSDRSGWWQLIALLPLIGWVWILVLLIRRGTPGPNRFGAAAAG